MRAAEPEIGGAGFPPPGAPVIEALGDDIAVQMAALPAGQFAAIAIDPPWKFKVRSAKGMGRSADRHYPTMTVDAIRALDVQRLAARDCALFMWVTDPFLEIGLSVMAAWGFRYKTVAFCWTKLNARAHGRLWLDDGDVFMGTGYWTRANAEMCLLGTVGRPKRLSKAVSRMIVAPVRQHSRKPDEFLPRVEQLVGGPYLEVFSRTARPGWTAVGNETGKFRETAA